MADPASRAGERYANEAVLQYVEKVHAPHDQALDRAYRANELHDIPPIHVGASEGKTLEILLRLVRAKKVVEVGTLAGYSALWMARALPEDGTLWTLEFDPKHAEIARENLSAESRVNVVEGDALASLAALEPEGPFCAVFVDADKQRYDQYGRWALKNLRKGGLLIGDNAYLFGNLTEETERARAMRAFHEEARDAFDSVCMPTPDGLVVAIKR